MILRNMLLLSISCITLNVIAQHQVNYNEAAIVPYVLPELLTLENGQRVLNTADWESKRRPEILKLYQEEVYGHIPPGSLTPASINLMEESDSALDNTAIRKQCALVYKQGDQTLTINVLLFLPKGKPFPPIFIGYNFYGNHTTIDDKHIIFSDAWVPNKADFGIWDNQPTEESRGKRNYRWPIQTIIAEGFGLATIYYGDVDPDRPDFSDGIHPFFYQEGQTIPADNEWGSISAWAWGYSQVLNYLKEDPSCHKSPLILFGHSRLGKTSLWAAALDDRFDMVITNNSGCGGSAIFRRKFGETASIINEHFPHWFNANFKKYSHHEDSLPIDQHMLVSLIAPRPVYITSAEQDRWADPKGEYLSGYHASAVYELYGKTGLPNATMPAIHEPIHNTIGYHIRSGKHDVTDYDWEQFMRFVSKHLHK